MITITINHFLILSSTLFMIGLGGAFLNRDHLIKIFLCIELMLLAVNINMVAFSYYLKDYAGQIFTIFILTVAAAEAAIGLAILVIYARNHESISVEPENN
jgi:NADH-quinone oxidoreductase subunit K